MTVDIASPSAPRGATRRFLRIMVERAKQILLSDYKISGRLLLLLMALLIYVWNDTRLRDNAFHERVLRGLETLDERITTIEGRVIVLETRKPTSSVKPLDQKEYESLARIIRDEIKQSLTQSK